MELMRFGFIPVILHIINGQNNLGFVEDRLAGYYSFSHRGQSMVGGGASTGPSAINVQRSNPACMDYGDISAMTIQMLGLALKEVGLGAGKRLSLGFGPGLSLGKTFTHALAGT